MSTILENNNKRIVKNTLFLYVRMFLIMGVSLYTSRVVLRVLGVQDFGIYDVVGGIVTLFAFINGGMISATQRYITFELGKGNRERLTAVFSTAIQIHAIISIVVVLLGETIGLWFLYNKMIIPEDRMYAAFWVYQCSIITCVINIMSIPYNADIIAHEKMAAFAYISVAEVFFKLGIVYLLTILPVDKLIVYAILISVVQLTIRCIYSLYCKKHFKESIYTHQVDKSLFKQMIAFAGWSFWGNLASVLSTQGQNIMLNIFFGPVVNAARGVAVQVQSAIQQFVGNFQMALNPQITKTYACGDMNGMQALMFRSAKFSFFLLFLLTLPVLLETNFILSIWLNTVPNNAVIFTQILLCLSLFATTTGSCVIANQATGKVKLYQTIVGGILLLVLPISYVSLKFGAPAYFVFIIQFIVALIAQVARIILLERLINLSFVKFFKKVYSPILKVVLVSVFLPFFVHSQLFEGWKRFFLVGMSSVLSVACSILIIGLTKNERSFVIDKGLQLLRIKR